MHSDRTQLLSSNNSPRIKSVYENLEFEHRIVNDSIKESNHPIQTKLKGIDRTCGQESIVRNTNFSKNNAPKRISLASLLIECEDYLGFKTKHSEHVGINDLCVQEDPRNGSTVGLSIDHIQPEALYSIPKKNARANNETANHQRRETFEANANIHKQNAIPAAREIPNSVSIFNKQESNCTNLILREKEHSDRSMTSTSKDVMTNQEEIAYDLPNRLMNPKNCSHRLSKGENEKYSGQTRIEHPEFYKEEITQERRKELDSSMAKYNLFKETGGRTAWPDVVPNTSLGRSTIDSRAVGDDMIANAETSNDGKSYNVNSSRDITKQDVSVGKVEDWIKTNVAKQVEQENRKFPFIRHKDVFWYIVYLPKF